MGYEELNDHDVKEIKRTWHPMKANYEKHSPKFLFLFFKKHPGYLKLFTFNHLTYDQLRTDAKFNIYSLNVVMALGEIVEGLDDRHRTAQELDFLGTSHRPRGVTGSHFKAIVPVLLDYLRDVNSSAAWNRSAEHAWMKFLDHLTGVVSDKLA